MDVAAQLDRTSRSDATVILMRGTEVSQDEAQRTLLMVADFYYTIHLSHARHLATISR